MKRREFLALQGGAAFIACSILRVGAQEERRAYVGFIGGGAAAASRDFLNALRDGLAALGYTEPATIRLDALFAERALDRIPALIEELENRGVDVIVTHAQATVPVVMQKRRTAVVYQSSADPVTVGIADTLAHPRHNATGITLLAAELNTKRLDLLREINPNIRRLAVIFNPLHPGEHLERAWLKERSQSLGIDVAYLPTSNRDELDRALGRLANEPVDGLLMLPDGFIVENRQPIIDLAVRRRLPTLSGWAPMAHAGVLITYGPRLVQAYRRSAYFVDRILRGQKAAALPIEQPEVLELIVNLKSATAISLTIPPSLLARADEVIE
jgi:putative ABC transport system substrate-binding protein